MILLKNNKLLIQNASLQLLTVMAPLAMFIKTKHQHSLLFLLLNTELPLARTSGMFCICHTAFDVLCMSLRPVLRIQCLSTCIKGKCSSSPGGVLMFHYFKLQSIGFSYWPVSKVYLSINENC